MKKVVSLLLIAIVTVSVAGCGKKENKKDKYKEIYCEKNSSSIKETISIKTGKPEEVNFYKEMSFTSDEEYKSSCLSYSDVSSKTGYNGVVNNYNCDDEKKVITETKRYIISDAKTSFEFSYIKKNGELDAKKFIEEFEIDGYKCEYK